MHAAHSKACLNAADASVEERWAGIAEHVAPGLGLASWSLLSGSVWQDHH